MSHYAIIGAGLTGLTAAYYLQKKGHQVTIFDKQETTGGVIQTHHQGEFVFESGPNTGVISHPEVAELFTDLQADCTIDIANKAAKHRWIWKGNRWETLPSGPISFFKTPLFSTADKFKLCAEPWQKKGTNPDETLDQLVIRRLGKSFLNYAVDPFISGVYAGDPSYLVTRYALPKLYLLEQNYGSFIRGAHRKKKETTDPRTKLATREVFSAKGGLNQLVQALVKNIGTENLRLNSQFLTIIYDSPNNFTLNGIDNNGPFSSPFSHVITTCGAHALPELLPFVDAPKLAPITNLVYAKVVQVILGFNKWKGIPINTFGGLVPSCEKREILGVLCPSSFLEKRAPKDGALLSVFLGGMRQPQVIELSDDALRSIVEKEVTSMMNLPEFAPDLVRIFRYHHAIPQYGASTGARLDAITNIETQYKGLTLAGNLSDGIGMGDRIKQGRKLGE